MEILQYVYLTVLNLIYKGTRHISPAVRQGIAFLSFFAMMLFLFVFYASKEFNWDLSYTQRGVFCIIFLSLAVIMSIDRPLKAVKWNPVFSIPWFVCGAIALVTSLLMEIGKGYLPLAICMLVVFPCMYLVWSGRGDYETLFDMAAKGFVICFFLFFVLCVIFYPFNILTVISGRYQGATGNPNTLGLISAGAMTCGLYLMTRAKRGGWLLAILACEIAFSFVIVSESRSALFSTIAQMGIFLIYYLRYYLREHDLLKSLFKVILLAVLIIGCLPLNQALLSNSVMPMRTEVTKVVKQIARDAKTEARIQRQKKRDKHPRRQEQSETPATDTTPDILAQEKPLQERFNTEGKDLNQISSGRLTLWKLYLQELSWKGHDAEDLIINPSTGRPMRSHNVFLEVAYHLGIAAGIFYLIAAVWAGVCILKFLFSRRFYKKYPSALFSVLAISSFCLVGMVETPIFPFEREVALFYFLGLAPLCIIRKGHHHR